MEHKISLIVHELKNIKQFDAIKPNLLKCLRNNKLVKNKTLKTSEELIDILSIKGKNEPCFIDCLLRSLKTSDELLYDICSNQNVKLEEFDTQDNTSKSKYFKEFKISINDNKYATYEAGNGSMKNVNSKKSEFFSASLKNQNTLDEKTYSVQLKIDGRCIEVFIFNISVNGISNKLVNIHSRTGPIIASVFIPEEKEKYLNINIQETGTNTLLSPKLYSEFSPNEKYLSIPEYYTILNNVTKIYIPTDKIISLIGEGTKDHMRPLLDQELKEKIKNNNYNFDNVKIPAWYCHTMMQKNLNNKTEINYPIEVINNFGISTTPIILSPSMNLYWSFEELHYHFHWLLVYSAKYLLNDREIKPDEHYIEGVIISKMRNDRKLSIKYKDPKFNDEQD